MFLGRLIGWNLFFAGLIVLVQDALAWTDTLVWAPLRVDQLWNEISPASLGSFETMAEIYLWMPLSTGLVTPLLACWAFAVLMVAGLLLVYFCRQRYRAPSRQPYPTPRPSGARR